MSTTYPTELLIKNMRIKELEAKLAETKENAMQAGCDRNKAEFKLAIAVEALEFYADEKNMVSLTGLPFGRRAREALKEVGEE
jgi:hypothetical protein